MSDVTDRIAQVGLEASTCTRCDLALTRRTVVFGEGNPETPMVLIGEGPGENEDATGRPFVGRAGALLDKALAENGITRKHVFICNVIKCRAAILEGSRLRNRPPRVEEIEACKPWLVTQLELIKPRVILCLGGPAASVVIHRAFAITRERGQWFESAYAPHAMATLHPAYVLRLQGEAYDSARRLLVEDIAEARRKVIEAKRQAPRTLFDLAEEEPS
ncbi:MAG TPA: uracil-DNA glycosylase [Armatimonadota bacterium]|jgi:DNA polymerase